MNVIEFFSEPFEKASLGWILVGSIVGGGIGAMIKLSTETIVPERYRRKSLAQEQFKRYKLPLLRAADALDRRLANFMSHHSEGWYESQEDDYYRVSTLYLFGQFFGWCKIIEDSEMFALDVPNKHLSEFINRFYRIFKGFTGFYYFKNSGQWMAGIKESTTPRLALTAIGELMIQNGDADTAHKIISFTDFNREIHENQDFIKWFGYLERAILVDQKARSRNARWNRLVVIQVLLCAFVDYLDPTNIHTCKRVITYPSPFNTRVKKLLTPDVERMGYKREIVDRTETTKTTS